MTSYPNGRDFTIDRDVLVEYHGYGAVVRVPEGVRHIGQGAFTRAVEKLSEWPPPMNSWDGMENPAIYDTYTEQVGYAFIREVILPESVETIGPFAFRKCENLAQVHLPSQLQRIGKEAFAYCYRLKQIEVPADTVIEDSAFFASSSQIIRKPE